MKWLKKTGSFVWYLLIILIFFYGLSSGPLSRIWGSLKSSDHGVLVEIARYFKNVDSLAILTMCISFGLAMGLLLLLNSWVDKGLKKLGARFPKANFVNAEWADYVIQTPIAGAILLVLFVIGSNAYVQLRSSSHRKDNVTEFTEAKPVVVLGTAKMLRSGKGVNLYYKYRIDAAIELWNAGKVKYFILSGDGVGEGHTEKYDETADMKADLLAAGVPEDKIEIDPYGLRTVDSSLRLRSEFNVGDVIYISQGFHTARAIIQSEFYGIKSESYDAKGSATGAMWRKEILQSRPALIVDVLFANMQPTVLGKDGKPIVWREEFSATKSNLHVMILIGTVLLVFISVMGYGFTRAKKGADREKAVRKFAFVSSGLSVLLIVMVWQIYETVDIKIFDEVVETVAASVGVKTEKMEKKEELKVKETIEQTQQPVAIVNASLAETTPKEKPRAVEFNTAENSTYQPVESAPATTTVAVKTETKKEDDMFNTAEGDNDLFNTSSEGSDEPAPVKKASKYSKATIYRSTTVAHEGSISIQLSDPVVVGGKTYPAGHVLEGKTLIYSNRIVIVADVDNSQIKNYEGGKEGFIIQARHQGKKGELVLSEGESITLGY
jgi:SanA protein